MPGPVLRAVTRELAPATGGAASARLELTPGESVEIGREGRLRIGVAVPDEAISRIALTVSAEPDGWRLHLTNRNGAMLHPWAQSPGWLAHGSRRTVRWPRVAVRLAGRDDTVEHWVLLEGDAYTVTTDPGLADDHQAGASATLVAPRPRGLTLNQLTAVYATFPEHLAWPPVVSATARSLESVAHRLRVTPSAVRERLKPVQERARELGLTGQFGVTEPEYVYHLAAHGFLTEVPAAFSA